MSAVGVAHDVDDIAALLRVPHAVPLVIGGGAVAPGRFSPAATAASYEAFAAWAAGSLELVRNQLLAVAFPLFAHTALHIAAHSHVHPFDVLAFFDANVSPFSRAWARELPALRLVLSRPGGPRDPALQQHRVGWTRAPVAPPPPNLRRGPELDATAALAAAAAGIGDAEVVPRLLDGAYRVPVALSPLALELLVEYLARSGSAFLLSVLNERVAVSVSDESVRTLVAGAGAPPAKVALPLPLHDVAAGVLRATEAAGGAAAATQQQPDRMTALRWGVRAGAGGPGGASDVAPPALPALGGSGGAGAIPYPDYGATAYGRSVLAAAAAAATASMRVSATRGQYRFDATLEAVAAASASAPRPLAPAAAAALRGVLLEPPRGGVAEVVDLSVSVEPPAAAATIPSHQAASAPPPPAAEVQCCAVRESASIDSDPDNVTRVVAVGCRSGAVAAFVTVAKLRIESAAGAAPPSAASAGAAGGVAAAPVPPRLSVTEVTLDLRSEPVAGAGVFGVAVSTCLRYVLAAGADGTARLFFLGPAVRQSGIALLRRLATAEGGSFVVPAMYDSTMKRAALVPELAPAERLYPLAVYRALQLDGAGLLPLWCAAFSPATAAVFSTGGRDGLVRVWSSASPDPQLVLAGHSGDVTACAFHPNAAYVVSGGADASLRVWDVAGSSAGDCVRVLTSRAAQAPVTCVAVAPSGRLCVSCDEAGSAVLWDLACGAAVAVYPTALLGSHPALSVAWAPAWAGLGGALPPLQPPPSAAAGAGWGSGGAAGGGSAEPGHGGGAFVIGNATGAVTLWDTAPALRRYAAALARLTPAVAAQGGGSAGLLLPCETAQLSPASGLLGSLQSRRGRGAQPAAPHALVFSVWATARGAPPVLYAVGPPALV